MFWRRRGTVTSLAKRSALRKGRGVTELEDQPFSRSLPLSVHPPPRSRSPSLSRAPCPDLPRRSPLSSRSCPFFLPPNVFSPLVRLAFLSAAKRVSILAPHRTQADRRASIFHPGLHLCQTLLTWSLTTNTVSFCGGAAADADFLPLRILPGKNRLAPSVRPYFGIGWNGVLRPTSVITVDEGMIVSNSSGRLYDDTKRALGLNCAWVRKSIHILIWVRETRGE